MKNITSNNEGFNDEVNKFMQRIEEIKKRFSPLSLEELTEILGLTIKKDDVNKVITFLCCLSAYTENSQLNLSFNAPSSSGKSYIPLEISTLFPQEDVKEIGYCTAQAFYHDVGNYDKNTKVYTIDLERKIIIFVDQPSPEVIKRLRPILSHDKKEIHAKITDKSDKFGLRTKNIMVRGFSAVIFCSAGLTIDEQEATRFMLLSPETSEEKIKNGIKEAIKKESDSGAYHNALKNDAKRLLLAERIKVIKEARVMEIKIHDSKKIEELFLSQNSTLKPRHQRDIKRLLSIIKSLALLNLWHREIEGSGVVLTSDEDVEVGFKLWNEISFSQDLNLPPYVHNIYKEVILPACTGGKKLNRKELLQKYSKVYGRPLEAWKLNKEILPMLENAGLISQEPNPEDKRSMLISPINPTDESTISESDGDNETIETQG